MKSRVRLVWPEFFTDAGLADLPKGTKLFYIGLWTLCDDDGYFPWEPRSIGAALFPYAAEPERVTWISGCLEELRAIERVEKLDCDRHGLVPTLPKYRMKGGRPTFPHRETHERTCMHVQERVVRNERFRFREDVGTRDVDGVAREASLDEAAQQAGGFVAEISKRRNGKSRSGSQSEPAQEGRNVEPEGRPVRTEHT